MWLAGRSLHHLSSCFLSSWLPRNLTMPFPEGLPQSSTMTTALHLAEHNKGLLQQFIGHILRMVKTSSPSTEFHLPDHSGSLEGCSQIRCIGQEPVSAAPVLLTPWLPLSGQRGSLAKGTVTVLALKAPKAMPLSLSSCPVLSEFQSLLSCSF